MSQMVSLVLFSCFSWVCGMVSGWFGRYSPTGGSGGVCSRVLSSGNMVVYPFETL